MLSSELAEIVPTCAIALLSLQGLLSFLSSSIAAMHRLVDAALDVHRVAAGGHGLEAFADDRLRQYGRSRRAVTGLIGGVGRDFLHHLRAHVLELVLELDFLRYRDAILGDRRGAEALLEHRIAAFGAQRRLDGVRQDVDAAEHSLSRIVAKTDFFRCHCRDPRLFAFNDGHDVFFTHDHEVFTLDFHFGAAVFAEQDLVADFHVERTYLPVFQNLALADRDDLALDGLFGRGVGNYDAAW